MQPLNLSLDDVNLHVVKFGIDIYPPIEIAAERTRLNMFYEEASRQWPHLYDELLSSNTQFEISKRFGSPGAPGSAKGQTLVLTPRGPVFIFPVALPPPIGKTGLDETPREQFAEVRELFFRSLPGRKCLRVGLVRDLIFATGQESCNTVITAKDEFSGARLVGGESTLSYRDAKCNVRVKLEPGEIAKTTQLALGKQITEPAGRGLHVELDVNNVDVRPLEDADIEEVLTRAASLWPDALLEYLRGQRSP